MKYNIRVGFPAGTVVHGGPMLKQSIPEGHAPRKQATLE